MAGDLAFVLVVEAGELERQAALLVESIRRFGGPLSQAPVWVIQPRAGRPVSSAALESFTENGAIFARADLNRVWRDYGYANKVYAAAFVEELVAGAVGTLVFVDSDFVFLQPPGQLVLLENETVAVRPVDNAGLGLPAPGPVNEYWQLLYSVCGVDAARIWDVTTTVDQRRIRAYFQGGLQCVRPSRGVFRACRDNLERLSKREDICQYAPESLERCFFEQALFAATVLATVPQNQVKLLDWHYNYPLPFHERLPGTGRAASLDDVVAVHYHREFDDLGWAEKINVREPVRGWLFPRLPLKKPRSPV